MNAQPTPRPAPTEPDPLERPADQKPAWKRAEMPTEWATFALYDDASGLSDEDHDEAQTALREIFERHGYRVTSVSNGQDGDVSEELEGRWNGLFAEGVTSEFMAVADDVMSADLDRGVHARLIDGAEYLLRVPDQDVIWLPTIWTSVIEAGHWDDDLWYEWNPETFQAVGPDAYNRWRAGADANPIRRIGRYGHIKTAPWNGERVEHTLWLVGDARGTDPRPAFPKTAPPQLPPASAEYLDEQA